MKDSDTQGRMEAAYDLKPGECERLIQYLSKHEPRLNESQKY